MIEFRILDFISPRRLFYWKWILSKSQYYTYEKMRTLQWKLLTKLLDHCFSNVPYYRELFAEHGLNRSDFSSLEDLSRIPILNKDVLLERNEDFKAEDFQRYRPRELHTSGTTGTPLRVYWDIDSNILELLCVWRHFSWAGYRLGESFLDIRSRIFDEPNDYKWNWKCRGLEVSSDNIDEMNVDKYVSLLRKYRVIMWRGHPAAIDYLLRLMNESGINNIKPKYIFTAAEAVLDHQREFIESYAGVPICDHYGLTEHNVFICQCPEGGYHIASEYGIVELIKEDGTPAQPGEEGRIVATGLHNKAFPLIRYDTRDYAIRSDEICSCGRTLPLIKKLTGRIDDRLLTVDGKWVSGLHFPFYYAKGITKAQLVQLQINELDVYLVPSRDYSCDTETYLCGELKKKLGEAMEICIHRVEEVPFCSSGKFKFVVNRLKNVAK